VRPRGGRVSHLVRGALSGIVTTARMKIPSRNVAIEDRLRGDRATARKWHRSLTASRSFVPRFACGDNSTWDGTPECGPLLQVGQIC